MFSRNFFSWTPLILADQGQNVVEGHKTIAIHGVDYKTTSAFFHCIQFDEKMTNDCIFLSEDKQKKAEFTLSSELVDQKVNLPETSRSTM